VGCRPSEAGRLGDSREDCWIGDDEVSLLGDSAEVSLLGDSADVCLLGDSDDVCLLGDSDDVCLLGDALGMLEPPLMPSRAGDSLLLSERPSVKRFPAGDLVLSPASPIREAKLEGRSDLPWKSAALGR
jgi:hypothetical protein